MQNPFRRGAAAPMTMLSLPVKTPLAFMPCEDMAAASKDADLEPFILCRSHLILAYSGKKTAPKVRGERLRAYLRQLDALAPRFDAAVARTGKKKICLAWLDAGPFTLRRSYTSLETERAVALFALAVEETRAAAEEDRRDPDGIRRACAALCDAAGLLRASASASEGSSSGDNKAPSTSGGDRLKHVSGACMAALEVMMLAQALECYFELAVAGGKPLALCAKVAQQVSLDYDRAQRSMAAAPDADKSWLTHAQVKSAYFGGEACLRSARVLRENGVGENLGVGIGEAIARLRQGLASLDGAKGALWKVAGPVRDATKRLRKEIETDLAAAERDNCRIYYARVPTTASLAELPGLPQPLVRPTAVEKVLRQGTETDASATGEQKAS
jgi:programmed cell death 6-interacting protein